MRAQEFRRPTTLLSTHHLLPDTDRSMWVVACTGHQLEAHDVSFCFLLPAMRELERDGGHLFGEIKCARPGSRDDRHTG